MPTLSSSTHCRSYCSSSNYGHHPTALSPKRFVPSKVFLQLNRKSWSNVVCMQDGALSAIVAPIESKSPSKKMTEEVLSVAPPKECTEAAGFDVNKDDSTVSITVVGASGDLAKKKIFPALFALFYEGCLPEHFTIFGYARSKMTDAELRNMVSRTLTCRIDQRENCSEKMDQFLNRCFYHSGQYDSQDNFAELDKKLKEHEVKWHGISTSLLGLKGLQGYLMERESSSGFYHIHQFIC